MAHHARGSALTLPNGAIWGYGRMGRSGGRPVLVHHGLIGDASFGSSDVTCPVDIWHFEGDTMVPFEAARHSAEQLTQVTRHFIEGDGHIATDAMLEDMTKVLAHA